MAQLPAASSAPSEDAVAIPTYEIRGERVVLDADLARLFGVETRRLNEQVRRNLTRFAGYAFPVDADARQDLMSQIATSRKASRKALVKTKKVAAINNHLVLLNIYLITYSFYNALPHGTGHW